MKKLLIFDFDGTIRDNTWDTLIMREIKSNIEKRKIINKDEKDKIIREKFVDKCIIEKEMQDLIESLSEKFVLVILSMAPTDYIMQILDKYNLTKYFDKIYSTITHFNDEVKLKKHFEKIFDDYSCDPSDAIHIGDDYALDYVTSEMGCETFLIDRCPINKYKISELGREIGKK